MLHFPGEIGDNYTGAHLGGLEVSKDNYLLVGSSVSLDERCFWNSNAKNLFLATIPKNVENEEDIRVQWLTNHSVNTGLNIIETHLVKVNEDKFVLLWTVQQQGESCLYYSIVNGDGETIKKAKKLKGVPSPGNLQPLFHNNSIIWYSAHYDLSQIELFQLHVE